MSVLALFALFAEGEGQGQGGNPLSMLIPMVAIFFVLYLVVLRPMKRQEAERQKQLLTNLKKNDKILTIGGIYGSVVSVAEKDDEVVVKVDDNTRIKIIKSAIARNITNEEDAKKAAEDAKKAKEAARAEAARK
jgi:preprotein translocase subunit YajC